MKSESTRFRARRWWLALAGGAAALLAYAFFVEPRWIAVTRDEVPLPVRSELTLAHLSDLHTRGVAATERALLARLAEERPDAIVITGDTLCQNGDYDECRPLLEKLRAPRGVFMVPGNWETANPRHDLRGFFKSCGVDYLRNESRELAPGLWLVGLDDFALGVPDLERALRGVPAGAATIVLCHEPAVLDQIAGRAPLLLAGHTHGGQVRLPFLPPLFLPKGCGRYVEGWYEAGGTRMFVSRGVGTTALPLRFLCRPELAILRLEPSATH